MSTVLTQNTFMTPEVPTGAATVDELQAGPAREAARERARRTAAAKYLPYVQQPSGSGSEAWKGFPWNKVDWAKTLDFDGKEQSEHLPPGLLKAMNHFESSGDPGALGRMTKYGNAMGHKQFIAETAVKYGVNPWDPESSAKGTARYMRALINQNGGNLARALAIYNGAESAFSNGQMKPFDQWPEATKSYVPGILSNMGWSKQQITSEISNATREDPTRLASNQFVNYRPGKGNNSAAAGTVYDNKPEPSSTSDTNWTAIFGMIATGAVGAVVGNFLGNFLGADIPGAGIIIAIVGAIVAAMNYGPQLGSWISGFLGGDSKSKDGQGNQRAQGAGVAQGQQMTAAQYQYLTPTQQLAPAQDVATVIEREDLRAIMQVPENSRAIVRMVPVGDGTLKMGGVRLDEIKEGEKPENAQIPGSVLVEKIVNAEAACNRIKGKAAMVAGAYASDTERDYNVGCAPAALPTPGKASDARAPGNQR